MVSNGDVVKLWNWLVNAFRCKHHHKRFVDNIPDYADPHGRLIGITSTYQCLQCAEYVQYYRELK